MKKRIFSVVLALALVLSLLPVHTIAIGEEAAATVLEQETVTELLTEETAPAVQVQAGHSDHGVCGSAGCVDHSDLTWTAWESGTSLPNTAGNYYLTGPVTIASQIAVTGVEVNLCLNGQTITLTGANNRIYNLSGGAKLTITDCASTAGKITSTAGLLATWGGAAVYMKDAATVLNLYRGQITGFTANGDQAYGAAVYMGGGTFNMYGGEITNNTSNSTNTSKKEAYAGAVYVAGTFKMSGGIISGNKTVSAKSSFGGAIFGATNGVVELSGGQICNNIAGYGNQTGRGGAVYLYKAKLTLSGSAKLYNNEATGAGGGAVYVDNTCTVKIAGGEIYGNKAGTGAGVYVGGGSLEISGGKLHHNVSTNAGGAVRMQSGTQFTISGGEIYENTAGSLGAGVYSAVAMTMSGGKIYNNTADNNGAGLYSGAALTMTGGEITGNNVTSTNGPGGVFAGNTITLSGVVNISGNTQAGTKPYNLRIGNYEIGFAEQGMQDGSCVGITCEGNATATMVFAKACDTDYSAAFFSDDDGYKVEYTADKTLKLAAMAAMTQIDLQGITLSEGQTGTLTAQPVPAGSAYGTLQWTSSDETVATVVPSQTDSLQAEVTGLKAGSVQITVTGKGGISATCTVTVLPEHEHCVCGDGASSRCDHQAEDWTPWLETTSLPTQAGNWYLTQDVQLSAAQAVPAGVQVKLCLNGHDVTLVKGNIRAFDLRSGAKLALTDCSATTTEGVYDAGKITMQEGLLGTWGGVGAYVHGEGSQLDVYQGIFTGLTASGDQAYGGAIYVASNATFNLYGGQISGNTAKSTNISKKEAFGGGVYVGNATMNYYGGTVSDNTLVSGGNAYGGGIYLGDKTVFTMTGGAISDNTAKTGGGIFATGAQASITDAQITGNTATVNGGSGIYAQGGSKLSLTDTSVTGNQNTAATADWCGGIVIPNSATTYTLAGKTVIDGNTVANGAQECNLLLQGADAVITVGALTEGASIGISSTTVPRFISGEAQWYEGVFTADQAYRKVDYKEGKYYFNYDTSHKHCICGDGMDPNCDHEAQEWIPWTDTTALPVVSGNYYLVNDMNVPVMGLLEATEDVKLCLNGKTITVTGENGRAYRVSGALTITDCTAHTDENGVYQAGKITGSVKANAVGSAIWVGTATSRLYLYEGKITGNTSAGDTTYGSVYIQAQGEFTMYGGEISDNKSEGVTAEYGGGVAIMSKGKFILVDGVIRGNEATNGGGVGNTQGTFEMKGGTITGNTATDGGGVVVRAEGTMTMTGGVISGNSAEHGGGIILLSKGDLQMSAGSVTGNTSKLHGGGIYLANTATMKQSGGTIRSNTSYQHGGGVYCAGKEASAKFTGGSITYNRASKEGGGAYISQGKATFSGCTVSNNKSTDSGGGITGRAEATVNFNGGIVTGNTSKHGAGIIVMSRAVLNLNGGTVSGNTSSLNGGGVYVSNDAFFNYNGGVIEKNTAGQHGGGFFANAAQVKLNAGEIRENTSAKEGGGAYCSGGTLRLDKTLVHNNTAKGSGGGICVRAFNTFDMTENVQVYGNTAENGGGIIVMSGSVLTMNGGEIYENYGITSGGGIYISYDSEFYMKDGVVRDNKSDIGGAGIYLNSPGVISGGKIHNNSVTGRDGYSGSFSGGGMIIGNKAGTVLITGGEIFENYTIGSGGAIRNSYGATLRMEGGKIYKNKAVLDSVGTLEILGGEIYKNDAGRYGGAFSGWPSANTLLQDVKIAENSATINGGAVYIPLGSNCVIRDVVITDHYAGRNGGAIYCEGDLILADVKITGNMANCAAVYLNDTTSDRESYVASMVKLEGDIQITDNTGKEFSGLYFAGESVATVSGKGLGKNTKIYANVESGNLTDTLFGSYDYALENGTYLVTYGDRSLTDPEVTAADAPVEETEQQEQEQQEASGGKLWLFVGIGAGVVALALILVLISRKKKSSK